MDDGFLFSPLFLLIQAFRKPEIEIGLYWWLDRAEKQTTGITLSESKYSVNSVNPPMTV